MSHNRPYAFTAQNRIKDRSDFIALRIHGRRLRTPHFYIHVLDKNEGLRLGVTVSRKIGNAVVRNRVKRLVREFFRHHYDQMPPAADISIVARPGAGSLNLAQASKELQVFLGSPPDRIDDD